MALAAVSASATHAATPAAACLAPASWYTVDERPPRLARENDVLADIARRDVVLLGERHDDADHHHWQVQTLSALRLLRPAMVIGFEAFPRRVQPALDDWVAGKLSVSHFLERTDWTKVWGVAPELYLPLFHFARINRIPMVALNVERAFVATVGKEGWNAVPDERREGVSRPASPSAEYEAYLFDVYKEHAEARRKDARPAARTDAAFGFFVESQTTWDRAMAEAIAARVTTSSGSKPLVVGIMGSGHVRHGYGVPHQLRDLGISSVGTLIPVGVADCKELKPKFATAVFAMPALPQDTAPRPLSAQKR